MEFKFFYNSYKHLPLLAIAFMLPFNFGVAIILVGFLFMFFLAGDLKANIRRLFSNKWTYVMFFLFLLPVVYWFFSTNKEAASTAIEIKLGFIVFPILLFSQGFNRIDVRRMMRFFAFGTICVTLINVSRAVFLYITEHDAKYFFYSDFSWFMHSSYYAMYAVFSIVLLSVFGLNNFRKRSSNVILVTVLSFILGAGVFMSSSKMGLLTLVIVLPILLFNMLIKQKKFKLLVVIGLLLLGGFIFLSQVTIMPVERLKSAFKFANKEQIDKTTTESNAVRALIWEQAVQIFKENMWVGVGPGDANDHLYRAYEKEGMTGALEKHLNCHNQFLQTAISTGLLGTLPLLLITLGIFLYGLLRRDLLKWMFALIIILNFLVESMLQTQAGTLFFLFFFSLLSIPFDITGNRRRSFKS